MDKLYQQVILQHNRAPRNYGQPLNYACCEKAYNPTCGDDLMVYLSFEQEIALKSVHFSGEACAVATAAASLMTEILWGLDSLEARRLCQEYIQAIEGGLELNAEKLVPMKPLLAVRQHAGRLGCATLSWKATIKLLSDRNA